MNALIVRNLSLAYEKKPILQDLSFSLQPKQHVLLSGPSGIGKSSLLHTLTGCIPNHIKAHQQGEVLLFDQPLSNYPLSEKIQTINVVFQQPHWQFVSLTVMDELAFGLGSLNVEKQHIRERIDDMLERLNIHELKNKKLHECSLGQQQMIACASILLLRPKIICLDEALSAVDRMRKRRFMEVIFQQVETVLAVDHQPDDQVVFNHRLELSTGKLHHV